MAGKKKIGVLALQGALIEHLKILSNPKLNCQVVPVKHNKQIEDLDGLIIPGGESTTIGKLMMEYNLINPIKKKAKAGMSIMGTCAGLIILAKKVKAKNPPYLLELIDIQVERNAYGGQINSFEGELNIASININGFPAVFIRAPQIVKTGDKVDILARHENKTVLAKQGNILVSSFHPELTNDLRIHQYFLNMTQY